MNKQINELTNKRITDEKKRTNEQIDEYTDKRTNDDITFFACYRKVWH